MTTTIKFASLAIHSAAKVVVTAPIASPPVVLTFTSLAGK